MLPLIKCINKTSSKHLLDQISDLILSWEFLSEISDLISILSISSMHHSIREFVLKNLNIFDDKALLFWIPQLIMMIRKEEILDIYVELRSIMMNDNKLDK